MPRDSFYARPHPLWKLQANGEPELDPASGHFVADLDAAGKAKVRRYTLAIGRGELTTKLRTAPPIPWVRFKTKRAAEAFILDFSSPLQK